MFSKFLLKKKQRKEITIIDWDDSNNSNEINKKNFFKILNLLISIRFITQSKIDLFHATRNFVSSTAEICDFLNLWTRYDSRKETFVIRTRNVPTLNRFEFEKLNYKDILIELIEKALEERMSDFEYFNREKLFFLISREEEFDVEIQRKKLNNSKISLIERIYEFDNALIQLHFAISRLNRIKNDIDDKSYPFNVPRDFINQCTVIDATQRQSFLNNIKRMNYHGDDIRITSKDFIPTKKTFAENTINYLIKRNLINIHSVISIYRAQIEISNIMKKQFRDISQPPGWTHWVYYNFLNDEISFSFFPKVYEPGFSLFLNYFFFFLFFKIFYETQNDTEKNDYYSILFLTPNNHDVLRENLTKILDDYFCFDQQEKKDALTSLSMIQAIHKNASSTERLKRNTRPPQRLTYDHHLPTRRRRNYQ